MWVTALIITTVICASVRWDNVYTDLKKIWDSQAKIEEKK